MRPRSPHDHSARRRQLLLAGGAGLLLTGCATGPRSPVTIIQQMLEATRASEDVYPLSNAEILANPAAQLGVRVDRMKPGVFQLVGQGAPGDEEYQWLIGGPILLVTHNGRIRATRGFSPELYSLQFHGLDPLINICRGIRESDSYSSARFAARSETRTHDIDEQIAVLRHQGNSQITLMGQTYACEHWRETVTTLPSRKQHENHFHVHRASGHVLESEQRPFHDAPLIRTQILKAPGSGPRT